MGLVEQVSCRSCCSSVVFLIYLFLFFFFDSDLASLQLHSGLRASSEGEQFWMRSGFPNTRRYRRQRLFFFSLGEYV